jgi:hypothetical protein
MRQGGLSGAGGDGGDCIDCWKGNWLTMLSFGVWLFLIVL